jgi:hypothetical protein
MKTEIQFEYPSACIPPAEYFLRSGVGRTLSDLMEWCSKTNYTIEKIEKHPEEPKRIKRALISWRNPHSISDDPRNKWQVTILTLDSEVK